MLSTLSLYEFLYTSPPHFLTSCATSHTYLSTSSHRTFSPHTLISLHCHFLPLHNHPPHTSSLSHAHPSTSTPSHSHIIIPSPSLIDCHITLSPPHPLTHSPSPPPSPYLSAAEGARSRVGEVARGTGRAHQAPALTAAAAGTGGRCRSCWGRGH